VIAHADRYVSCQSSKIFIPALYYSLLVAALRLELWMKTAICGYEFDIGRRMQSQHFKTESISF